ncbi:MAG: hypothetical protein V1900_03855 [Candidatus Aenigmatarchaeota archaeon]
MIEVLKAAFSIVYFFLIPGLLMTYCIFKKDELNILERIGVSIGLSIVIIPIMMFSSMIILKIPVNEMNIFLETTFLNLVLFALAMYKNKEFMLSLFKKVS